MQGKEKMIDDILQSAKTTAAAMVEEAEAERADAETALRAELEKAKADSDAEAARAADSAYSGLVKLGELEAGKIMLDARQRVVAAVYDGVRARITGAGDAEYLGLMHKLVVEACEDGDEVIPPKGDKRITAAWVKKAATAAKLSLGKPEDISGGLILRNSKYDRALTVDEIVADLKERTVADTAKKLGL